MEKRVKGEKQKMNRNRKGISPLIATLLLIAIAVSASVLVYAWTMSMVQTQATQAQTQIRIEDVSWDKLNNRCTIKIRNMGSVQCKIESIAIKENISGTNYYYNNNINKYIDVGEYIDVTWSNPAPIPSTPTITSGHSYSIRATASTGFYAEYIGTVP